MGIFSIYGEDKVYRTMCTMTLHSDMVGNINNSNFGEQYMNSPNDEDVKIIVPPFYLTEMPTMSFSSELGTNNGAKIAESLSKMNEGEVAGINLAEIVANNGTNGYIPSFVMGSNSFKVVKNASKLAVTLKTRILYDPKQPHSLQPYVVLMETLMKLALPSESSRISTDKVLTDLSNFVDGVAGTIYDGNSAIGGIKLDDLKNAFTEIGGLYLDTAKMAVASQDKAAQLKSKIEGRKESISKYSNGVGKQLSTVVSSLIKNYIYREYITLDFTKPNNANKPLSSYNNLKKYKFILNGFSVTQSNQLYGDTLNPIYMDFDINLQSLGVVIADELGNS